MQQGIDYLPLLWQALGTIRGHPLYSGLIFLSLHPPIGTLGESFCNSLVRVLTLNKLLVLGRIDLIMNGDGLLIAIIMSGSMI